MRGAFVLNNTAGEGHFGCNRVMRLLTRNLADRGIQITGSVPVGTVAAPSRWQRKLAAKADLIVVNGEGTLHDGTRRAENLLRSANVLLEQRKGGGVLLNALYQNNPREWARYLEAFDLIYARDRRSADELSYVTGRSIPVVPDLTLSCTPALAEAKSERHDVTISDSVVPDFRAVLEGEAEAVPGVIQLPITTGRKARKPHWHPLFSALRDIHIAFDNIWSRNHRRNFYTPRNEFDFEKMLTSSKLHVTGRFHAACFCLTTFTPFLALSSNSWKVESMMNDMGVDARRLIGLHEVGEALRSPDDFAFTLAELSKVRLSLESARLAARNMFDEVAALRRE